jgi:hypothetical protein
MKIAFSGTFGAIQSTLKMFFVLRMFHLKTDLNVHQRTVKEFSKKSVISYLE